MLMLILLILQSLNNEERFSSMHITTIPFESPFSKNFFNHKQKIKTIGIPDYRWEQYFESDPRIKVNVKIKKSPKDLVEMLTTNKLDAVILSDLPNLPNLKKLYHIGDSYAAILVPYSKSIADVTDIKSHNTIGVDSEGYIHAKKVFGFLNIKPKFVVGKNNKELIKLYSDNKVDCVYMLLPEDGNKLLEKLSKVRKSYLIGFSPINNGHIYNTITNMEKSFYESNPGMEKALLDIITLSNKFPNLTINKGGRSKMYIPSIKIKHYIVALK